MLGISSVSQRYFFLKKKIRRSSVSSRPEPVEKRNVSEEIDYTTSSPNRKNRNIFSNFLLFPQRTIDF